MPLPLAILCGIFLAVLIFSGGLGLVILSILLLPIYYAVKNVLTELHRVGKWKIGWERFFQVSFTELMIGLMLLVGEGKEPTSISGWIMAYLLYLLATSIFVSISKDVQI